MQLKQEQGMIQDLAVRNSVQVQNKLIFDKRDGSQIDFLTAAVLVTDPVTAAGNLSMVQPRSMKLHRNLPMQMIRRDL